MSALSWGIRIARLSGEFGLDWFVYHDSASGLNVGTWTGDYELRKMVAVWSRTPASGIAQDAAMTTHHFLNLTGGSPDATWLDADFLQVENAFKALWTAIKPDYHTTVMLQELRWYADGPSFKPHGSASSPILRNVPVNVAGTAVSAQLPPQCAISVTEVTTARYSVPPREGRPGQLRHRWGRFYLPAPITSKVDVGGRFNASATWASYVESFYNTCRATNQLVPVMYSPTTGNTWSVDEIHLDDIVDVIRSRRWDGPLTRNAKVLAALA